MRHPRDPATRRGPDLLTQRAGSPVHPAAAITTYIVKPGELDAFKAWADRLDGATAAAPGFLDTMRLEQTGGVIHLLHRFDSADNRDAWSATANFRVLAAEADHYSHGRRQLGAGRELRFSLPGEANAAKWKRFLMTVAAVFPVLLVLNGLGGLTGLPQIARLAITSPLLTALLTWVILPRVTRWLRPWILTDAQGRPRKPGE
jgi:antibiotic biosynthesis monooxygenase (ABM) superfamily enzyme